VLSISDLEYQYYSSLASGRIDNLEGAYASRVLAQEAAAARGFTIGTNGKAVVAFREDHWLDEFRTKVISLLQARSIPFGLAHLTNFSVGGDGGSMNTTWADVFAWHKRGGEVWSHGSNHKDPTPDGYAGLIREIVGTKTEIESHFIKCQGWMQPGISEQLTDEVPYDGMFADESTINSQTGRLLMSTHAHIEGDIGGYFRSLPTGVQYGLGHYTIDSVTSLATLTALVEEAEDNKSGIEFMLHASMLDDATRITTAILTSFLDYLVTEWDAGRIEILTPSGLYYADPYSTYRKNLVLDGGFEGIVIDTGADTLGAWDLVTDIYSLGTDGGHTGTNYLIVPAVTGSSVVRQVMEVGKHSPGQTYMLEAWFKNVGAASVARMIVVDHDVPSNMTETKTMNMGIDQGWTKLRLAFTPPLNMTGELRIQVGRNGITGGTIHVDDVTVQPI